MLIIPVKSPGLAHTSYYISNKGESFIVDPRRDVEYYLKLTRNDCAYIKYVFETHRNEDYIIGSLELKEAASVEICHSKETPFKYGDHSLSDGDRFQIGDLEVECLWTPGHTFGSMCYVLYDLKGCDDPLAVFTGDTLFIGDVGRTDLPGEEFWEEMSNRMYHSLHEKILPLGDHVILYPSHTAGSICGSHISNREVSTIGYEKLTNIQLSLRREKFIENRLNNEMPRPPYFRRMEDWNLNGAPLLKEVSKPKLLRPEEFEKEAEKPNTFILDTRQPDAFAASHMIGSVNIWLRGTTYFPGWVIDYKEGILLVLERKEDILIVATYLHRIGYDDIVGYLCPGIDAWRNTGKPTETFDSMHIDELRKLLNNDKVHVLDVREDHEYLSGHIEGSQNIYVGQLMNKLDQVPKDSYICLTCGWGGRGGIAASLLKKKGYRVGNLLGGMHAWNGAKQPIEVDADYLEEQKRMPRARTIEELLKEDKVIGRWIFRGTHEGNFFNLPLSARVGHELSNRVILEECVRPSIDEFHERHADEQLRKPEAYMETGDRLGKVIMIRIFIPKGEAKTLHVLQPELLDNIMERWHTCRDS